MLKNDLKSEYILNKKLPTDKEKLYKIKRLSAR